MVKDRNQIRCSDEFHNLLHKFKAKCMMEGGKCPSDAFITKIIAKKINSEETWFYENIKF